MTTVVTGCLLKMQILNQAAKALFFTAQSWLSPVLDYSKDSSEAKAMRKGWGNRQDYEGEGKIGQCESTVSGAQRLHHT